MLRTFWDYLKNEDFAVNRFWTNLFDGHLSDGGLIRGPIAAAPVARPAAEAAAVAAAVEVASQPVLGLALFGVALRQSPGIDFVLGSVDLPLQLAGFDILPASADVPAVAAARQTSDEAEPAEASGPVASPHDHPTEILSPFGAASDGAPMAVALFSTSSSRDAPFGVSAKSAASAASGRYQVLFSADLVPSLVIDTANREILTGGAQDPELGAGDDDTLSLSGDFSAGANLPPGLQGIDTLVLGPDNDYLLASSDDNVTIGDTLTVNAMPLGPGEHVEFDGSAETDGQFVFFGGAGSDIFSGGAGNDRMHGLLGADSLTGGGGADIFAYTGAAESSGASYDTLADFDPGADRIDLVGGVSGFADAVEGGTLAADNFDADLAAALGPDRLGSGQAVLFAPDDGSLAGTLFLIVDANGQAGYQAGEDYVFALPGADLAALDGNTAIFI